MITRRQVQRRVIDGTPAYWDLLQRNYRPVKRYARAGTERTHLVSPLKLNTKEDYEAYREARRETQAQ